MAPSLVLGLVLLSGTLGTLGTPSPPGLSRDLSPWEEVTLDMALDSFDDQYRGCGSAMERELGALNASEFSTGSLYAQAWAVAAIEWRSRRGRDPKMPPRLRPELAVAITAYTVPGPLHRVFNAATRSAGRSRRDYLEKFDFKTLHFLLTQALSLLRDSRAPQKCFHVYREVQGLRFTSRPGQLVRFGHFASSSLRNESSWSFGHDTSFSIRTCWGVPIRDFSFFPEEEDVLIPPYETFNVTGVTQHGDKTFLQLRSQGTFSRYNCEFVRGSSILRAPPQLWGLLLALPILAAIRDP